MVAALDSVSTPKYFKIVFEIVINGPEMGVLALAVMEDEAIDGSIPFVV